MVLGRALACCKSPSQQPLRASDNPSMIGRFQPQRFALAHVFACRARSAMPVRQAPAGRRPFDPQAAVARVAAAVGRLRDPARFDISELRQLHHALVDPPRFFQTPQALDYAQAPKDLVEAVLWLQRNRPRTSTFSQVVAVLWPLWVIRMAPNARRNVSESSPGEKLEKVIGDIHARLRMDVRLVATFRAFRADELFSEDIVLTSRILWVLTNAWSQWALYMRAAKPKVTDPSLNLEHWLANRRCGDGVRDASHLEISEQSTMDFRQALETLEEVNEALTFVCLSRCRHTWKPQDILKIRSHHEALNTIYWLPFIDLPGHEASEFLATVKKFFIDHPHQCLRALEIEAGRRPKRGDLVNTQEKWRATYLRLPLKLLWRAASLIARHNPAADALDDGWVHFLAGPEPGDLARAAGHEPDVTLRCFQMGQAVRGRFSGTQVRLLQAMAQQSETRKATWLAGPGGHREVLALMLMTELVNHTGLLAHNDVEPVTVLDDELRQQVQSMIVRIPLERKQWIAKRWLGEALREGVLRREQRDNAVVLLRALFDTNDLLQS